MKSELGYPEDRIEKIKKWAIAKQLVRLCEYDEDTLEYWVNVRTSGTLSREDLLTLSKSRTHEQETTADAFAHEQVDLSVGGFPDLGGAEPALATEGDKSLGVKQKLAMYLKNGLKAKNSVSTVADKIRALALEDQSCKALSEKIDAEFLKMTRFELSQTVVHIAKIYGKGAPAADCVEEAQSASVKDDCPVLRRIASARVADPDEPLFKALKDCGHALDVPVTTLKLDNTFEYPCLHPRDFAASCIIYFCAKTFKSSRIGLALDHVNLLFRNFLATEKERVNFSNITFELLGYESSRTYPMGHWSKNLDTAVMIKFVEHVAANNLDPGDPVMQLIVQGSSAINHFMRVLLSAPYWLCESEAWQAIFAGQEFLSAFAGLAQACYHQILLATSQD
ncbi:unnamed protein product [Cladocopium goreaui]|uniref:Uncharacterized protein n=1 Tax=Cladocopium goreaui TaxID=2562237 RepID=A0A9P1BK16_9DINO|nr:unnamed protein product [Cladocopium goreaui]